MNKEIGNLTNENIVIKHGEINGGSLRIFKLKNCIVSICDWMGVLQLNELDNCTIYSGPVAGPAQIIKCNNCVIVCMPRQSRIHECIDTSFFLHCTTGPIIEDCKGCKFGNYFIIYTELQNDITNSNHDININLYKEVKDFKWIKRIPSPNFTLLPLKDYPDKVLIDTVQMSKEIN